MSPLRDDLLARVRLDLNEEKLNVLYDPFCSMSYFPARFQPKLLYSNVRFRVNFEVTSAPAGPLGTDLEI